jgi:N-hydroxyarylamine O-acetyltransferase
MRVHRHRLTRADPGLQHPHLVVLEQEAVEIRRSSQRVERVGPLPADGLCASHDGLSQSAHRRSTRWSPLCYEDPVNRGTVAAVLEKLGADPPAPDRAGLDAVYAAWCRAVPFDNVLKLTHLAGGRPGPLPGSTAESFFRAWLEHGTGGTCWAGNAALYELLEALGFDVARAFATMLSSPEARGPNHGTVIVTIDGERWIADASILSGEPIRIPPKGEPATPGPLPRFEWLAGSPAVIWRMPTVPDGFPCRIDRIGAESGEWDVLHQRTGRWSPFNYQLNVRIMKADTSVGVSAGQRFAFDADGSLSTSRLDQEGRVRLLVEEIGIAEEIAVRVPDDRPVPPRPEGHGQPR